MKLRIRKLAAAPDAKYAPAVNHTPGTESKGFSLPIDYEVVGLTIGPLAVGHSLTLARQERNGVKADGIFRSSPVVEIGLGWFKTMNSIYEFSIL